MSARIGIDLGGTKLSGVVLGADGAELTRLRRSSPREDYAGTVRAVAALVADLEGAAGLEPGRTRVGIGTPGAWLERLGQMKNCNSTWLNGRPLLPDLARLLGHRVRLANDADCLGLSEAADGAGAGQTAVFAVILGTGVGGALISAGRLAAGPNGLSGEWGHTPLPYFRARVFVRESQAEADRYQLESRLRDRPCYCGRLNCIETFLAGPGLARTHEELWGEPLAAHDVAASAGAGTDNAVRTMTLYHHMLARSLAQIVNVIDPGVIVLGGGVSKVASLYPALASQVPGFAFSSVAGADDVRVDVRAARWGDDSGVRGAARLWDT